MREKSELLLSQIANDFFLGEFSFDTLQYVPANLNNGNNKELADLIINYGDNLIAFQIKERKGDGKPDGDLKWVKRHTEDAKNQLVDTFTQLNNNILPEFKNGKGESCFIKEGGLFTGIIILYNSNITKYKRVLVCKRLSGLLHCFSYIDFKKMCEKLVLPADMMEYLYYREKKIPFDKDINMDEETLINEFLLKKYKATKFEAEELDIFRGLLRDYHAHLDDGNCGKYREIIEVLLEFDRVWVYAFSQKLGYTLEMAGKGIKSNQCFIIPQNPETCSFLFISTDAFYKDLIERMALTFLYKTKRSRCMTVVVYYINEKEFRIDWVYIEQSWQYDEEMENICNDPDIRDLWVPKIAMTHEYVNK